MKTLSIQQPWASLIVAGIKDVENRTWKPNYTGRILIHASSKKVPKSFEDHLPEEWVSLLKNARNMGSLNAYSELPTSAIIGYVEVTGYADQTESIWDGGEECTKWLLSDPYLFDEPILDVKGKLNLFEYPLDENNLPPAHQVKRLEITADGDRLILPVSATLFDQIEQGERELMIDVTAENIDFFCPNPDNYELRPCQTIELVCGTQRATYQVKTSAAYAYLDPETEEGYLYTNLHGEETEWSYIGIELADKITD